MSGDIERLERLENGLRTTQDSILLMSKDIHSLNESTKSIASSMKTLVSLQQDMKVMEERYETRHKELKHSDEIIHVRVDKLSAKCEATSASSDNGERAYKVLVQIAKWLGAGVAGLFLAAFVYVIQLKG